MEKEISIQIKGKQVEIEEWLKKEFLSIQTGRVQSNILDNVKIDVYGSQNKVNALASVNVQDNKTLLLTPYDPSTIKSIETAIINSDLGLSLSIGETSIRISVPDMTEERREQLKKVVKAKLEEAKISWKQAREQLQKIIDQKEKDKEISEDEKFQWKKELQEEIEKSQESLEKMTEGKLSDLSS